MITGVEARRGSAFISARASRPFIRGMFISIKTRAARIPGRRRRWSSAMPSGSHTRVCPFPVRFHAASNNRKSGRLSSATTTGQLVLAFICRESLHYDLSARRRGSIGGTDDRLLSSYGFLALATTAHARRCSAPPGALVCLGAEREEKRSAHARFAFGPDAPPVL